MQFIYFSKIFFSCSSCFLLRLTTDPRIPLGLSLIFLTIFLFFFPDAIRTPFLIKSVRYMRYVLLEIPFVISGDLLELEGFQTPQRPSTFLLLLYRSQHVKDYCAGNVQALPHYQAHSPQALMSLYNSNNKLL